MDTGHPLPLVLAVKTSITSYYKRYKLDCKGIRLACPHSVPDGLAGTVESTKPEAGLGQVGVVAGTVPLMVGCRPRAPGLGMATAGATAVRPGPDKGADVCTFT